MRRRVGRVVAAVVVAAAVVSGCAGGPSQVGSAVIVGDTAIGLGEVQDDIAAALRSDRTSVAAELGLTDQQAVARYVVSDAIRHELLADRAAAEGLTVSEQEVDAALAAPGGAAALFDGERARQAARDQLLAGRLGAREVDRLTVTLDLAVAPSEAEARTVAQALAAGDPGVTTQPLEIPAAQALGQFPLFPFGTPVGSVVVLEPSQPEQVEVVRITDRTEAPSAAPVADQVPPDLLASFGYQLLQGDAAGIQVNPRYGVFDPLQMSVVAPDDVVGTVLPPVDQR